MISASSTDLQVPFPLPSIQHLPAAWAFHKKIFGQTRTRGTAITSRVRCRYLANSHGCLSIVNHTSYSLAATAFMMHPSFPHLCLMCFLGNDVSFRKSLFSAA